MQQSARKSVTFGSKTAKMNEGGSGAGYRHTTRAVRFIELLLQRLITRLEAGIGPER